MKNHFKEFFKQEWIQNLIPVVGWLYITAVCKTLRYQVTGEERVKELKKDGKPVILACWHGSLVPPMYYLRNRNIHVLSSTHRDSEYLAWILRKFGWGLVKGSTKRGGTRALIEMIKKLKEGYDIAMTPDGPTGPAKKLKPGLLYLAKKTGIPIVPTGIGAYPCSYLKSWDSFMVPKFFAKTSIVFGDPFWVDSEITEEELENKTLQLEKVLNQLSDQAQEIAVTRS